MTRIGAIRRRRAARPQVLRASASLVACLVAGAADAAGVAPSVPWMPDTSSRHAIELLVDEAGLDLPVMQWPLPSRAVAQALDALPAELAPELAVARDRVRAALKRQRGVQLDVTAREHADGLAGFGDDATPGSSVELRSGMLEGPHLAMQLGARVDPRPDPAASGSVLRLDDSAIVLGDAGIQLEAWSHRSWWGPGWQSALALSDNAPALGGVGIERSSASTSDSPWLSWLGPWSVQAFAARSEGQTTPAWPFVLGARFEFRPFSHLEVGFERTAQWGGVGRNQSARSFIDAVLGLHTNADTAQQVAIDPANEMAGYDVRVRCPDFLRCAVYGQAIGEDSAGHLPSRFLSLGGLELWSADGRHRLFAEAARTSAYRDWFGPPITAYAYRNYAYPSGYTTAGRWLGANAGPDSRLFTLGWIDAEADSTVRVTAGHVGSRIGTFSPDTFDAHSSGRLLGLSLRRSFDLGPATWTPEFDWNRVQAPDGHHQQTRLGLEMRMNLDDLSRTGPGWSSGTFAGDGGLGNPVILSAAAIGGALLLDRVADRYAVSHIHDTTSIAIHHIGSAMPYLELGVAGAAWLGLEDRRASGTALSSVEAGLTAAVAAEALKGAIRRERPGANLGPDDYGHASKLNGSFPSLHSSLAWAVLTPVAQEYDAPWLYGVAAVTNAARVFGRDHWLSDTIAGAVLGYWIGDAFHAHDATRDASAPRVALGPRSVALMFPLP